MGYNLAAIPVPAGSQVALDSIKIFDDGLGQPTVGLDFVTPEGKNGHAVFPLALIEDSSKPDPKEAARNDSRFYVVSKRPDCCLSPEKPVPYQIIAEFSESVDYSPNVRYTGSNAVVYDPTYAPSVKGDAKGEGGGVKSGTFLDRVETAGGSKTVKVNGKLQVRVDDICYLNCKNTFGPVKDRMDLTPEADTSVDSTAAAAQGVGAPNAGEKFDSFMAEANNYLEALKDKAVEYGTIINDATGGTLGQAAQGINAQLDRLDIQALKDISDWADRTYEAGAEAAGGNRALLLFFAISKAAKDIVMPEGLLDGPGPNLRKVMAGPNPETVGRIAQASEKPKGGDGLPPKAPEEPPKVPEDREAGTRVSRPASRPLEATDLGVSRDALQDVRGTVTNAGNTRIISVDMVRGRVPAGELRSALPNMLNSAKASGIKTLQIEGIFALDSLEGFAMRQAEKLGGIVSTVGGKTTITFNIGGP